MFGAKKSRLSWHDALKFINKCPSCGAVYSTDKARLFAQSNTVNLVHITCSDCGGGFIAMILVMNQGISTIGMLSDLSFEDAKRLYALSPISIDELIEGREEIKKFVYPLSINS